MTHPSNQRSIRDDIRATIEGGIVLSRWDDEQILFASKIADLLLASPVIRSIQAEAWDEGFDAHDEDWKHHDANNWGNEECLDVTYNPYREEEANV